ncbi:MAG: twin-arginine translocase TatA/TatE family subunit [Actinobacteria bacterium]|nr:twin-arginine translocase TatA/TatE family subunit [Actinomycetota bacterium]
MVLVAAVALVVFGPDRLPELARNAGRMVARFRAETSRSVADLKRAADLEDLDRELRGLRQDLSSVRSSVTGAFLAEPARPRTRPADAPPPIDPEAP